ncbi:hypothetical protein EVA_10381, partial [gut metagenome]
IPQQPPAPLQYGIVNQELSLLV